MTNEQKMLYDSAEELRQLLWETLAGRKFQLQCGHHITFGQYLGNDMTLRNGPPNKGFKIICSQCGYGG